MVTAMTDRERDPLAEVQRLRDVLLRVYPYVPLRAGGPALQEELERTVIGERSARAYFRRLAVVR